MTFLTLLVLLALACIAPLIAYNVFLFVVVAIEQLGLLVALAMFGIILLIIAFVYWMGML